MLLNSHDARINTFFTSSLVFLLASSWRVFLRLMMHMMIKATKIPNTTTTTAITASFRLLTSENINLSDKKAKSSHRGKNTKFTKEKHCKSKQNVPIIWYCYSVKKKSDFKMCKNIFKESRSFVITWYFCSPMKFSIVIAFNLCSPIKVYIVITYNMCTPITVYIEHTWIYV